MGVRDLFTLSIIRECTVNDTDNVMYADYCATHSLSPGYCIWNSTTSCSITDGSRKSCYCDPFCTDEYFNDCCADVPDSKLLIIIIIIIIYIFCLKI